MRQAFLIGGLGLATPLALAPFFWLPVLYLTVPAFLTMLYTSPRTKREIFFLGWFFGFGFFLSSLTGIAHAIVFNLPFSYAWPVAILLLILLCAFLALFIALSGIIVYRAPTFFLRVFLWVVVFLIMEWLRGHILTGLPWNLLGYAWNFSLPLMQVNAVLGIYGTTLLVMFSVCAVTWLNLEDARVRRVGWVFFLGIPLIVWAFGTGRLNAVPASGVEQSDFLVRIVQPNIPQEIKWLDSMAEENLRQLLRISVIDLPENTGAILWPETAVSWSLNQQEGLRRQIASFVDHVVVTGSLRQEGDNVYNSLFIMDREGNIVAYYDKAHLVPFGEYTPLRRYIPFLNNTQRGLSEGVARKNLDLPHSHQFLSKKIAPLVCYEAIFPHQVVQKGEMPDMLINISNDAWYGRTSMPYQHAEMARVRAVEEGRPLLRSANTGISAAWDAWGRPLGSLALNKAGALDIAVPQQTIRTAYAENGDRYFAFLLFFMTGLGIMFWLLFR